jgi:hypothetical protein
MADSFLPLSFVGSQARYWFAEEAGAAGTAGVVGFPGTAGVALLVALARPFFLGASIAF